MFYPLKFEPVYKDYIWGGRNLSRLGKKLPDGIVAESWEVSCHPDGTSIIANGEFKGLPLPELIKRFGRSVMGSALSGKDMEKFPLLVKFIDANDNLSVQVHPDDSYAHEHENGEYGKNEMWYIMSAEPGARLIYDVSPGTDRKVFEEAVKAGTVESCLKTVEVAPGDAINIPSGLVHAIGKGIMLAEVQQNSNSTYRVFDYNRLDKNGNQRPLHIEKALDVIDFNSAGRKEKYRGLEVICSSGFTKRYLVVNRYFSVELYAVDGTAVEGAYGDRFFIYTFIEGSGEILYKEGSLEVCAGESVLIPASLGAYSLAGRVKALKSYVPDIRRDVVAPLAENGYTMEDIYQHVGGFEPLQE